MTNQLNESLPYLSNPERLEVYNLLIQGCSHIYSKGKLQTEKALQVLNSLIPLTQKDPLFLAHLTSYVLTKTDNKDLQVFTSYVNSLSSADGTPFSVGSKYLKPNLRFISAAAVHRLEPKLSNRVLEIASLKYGVTDYLNEARHFPNSLRTALEKYLQYREVNLEIMRGIKKAGLGNVVKELYRGLHKSPTDEVAAILRWKQKDRKIEFESSQFDFKDKTDLEIAENIRKNKLPVLGVLGALPRQISPVIAVALLEQATGNQAVILRKTFEDAGVLKDKEIMKLYEEKIRTAKTALDRVETLSETASEAVKQVLKQARADVRKEQVGELGKMFLHLDASGSMEEVFEIAKKRGAILAEIVKDPKENFKWGSFNINGEMLPLPEEFVEDAFAAVLFGKVADGGTDAFALYPEARKFGANIDVLITDGGHNVGDLGKKIRDFHEKYPDLPKPKVCVIVKVSGEEVSDVIKESYEENGIPVSVMKPEALTETALVSTAIRTALLGPMEIVDEIMTQKLLKLPEYYYTL